MNFNNNVQMTLFCKGKQLKLRHLCIEFCTNSLTFALTSVYLLKLKYGTVKFGLGSNKHLPNLVIKADIRWNGYILCTKADFW